MASCLLVGGPYAGMLYDATGARIMMPRAGYERHRVQARWANGSFEMEVYKHESMSPEDANRAAVAMFIAEMMLGAKS